MGWKRNKKMKRGNWTVSARHLVGKMEMLSITVQYKNRTVFDGFVNPVVGVDELDGSS